MAVNTKAIKGRIKSVKNTKKITKAMEMVAAAKMRRAVEGTVNNRLYARFARELLEKVSDIADPNIALLECRPVEKILVILVSSNRGLCGSFNSNLFKKIKTILEDPENLGAHRHKNGDSPAPADNINIDIVGIGRKTALFAKRYGYNLVSVYDNLGDKPEFEDILPISSMAINAYTAKDYDKVVVAYTEYESSIVQTAKVRQLLPLSKGDLEKMLEMKDEYKLEEEEYDISTYLFEPSLDEVVETVLPRLVESQLYAAVLESAASEHSARMLAMKNASDAAGDMIDELTREFNKGRQAAITQEIAEIAGGAAALE